MTAGPTSKSPIWAALRLISQRASVARAAEYERALAELRALLGPHGAAAGRHGILVAKRDLEVIRSVFPRYVPKPWLDSMPVSGIPIIAVPDWTMDPSKVAQARLVAVLQRPLVRLLRWVGRHHPASDE